MLEFVIAILVLLFGSLSIYFMYMVFSNKAKEKKHEKVLGCCAIAFLSLVANQGYVFAVSVIVIATMVTELDFIEKIAAIVRNNKEYWKYKIATATSEDIAEKKLDEEVKETELAGICEESCDDNKSDSSNELEIDTREVGDIKSSIIKGGGFECIVYRDLRDTDLFGSKLIKREVKIVSPNGEKIVVDAIIETAECDYIVEIKYKFSAKFSLYIERFLNSAVRIYSNYAAERKISKKIVPVLIIQNNKSVGDSVCGIPVLKYDIKMMTFSNVDGFRASVMKWTDSALCKYAHE